MRARAWIAALLLAVVAIASAVFFLHVHGTSNSAQLVAFLPSTNAALVYVNVAAIRRAGFLETITGSHPVEEAEYRQFVDQTGFDYRRDLDAVAVAFKDGHVFLAARGRFHWKNLAEYARGQGGTCHNEYCVVAGSRPGRRISFYPVKTDVMGMAVGPDDFAAYQVARQPGKLSLKPPGEPVWALIPAAELKQPSELPTGAKPFASALENAEEALFTIGPHGDHLQLDALVTCRDAPAASALVTNLENTTATLRKWIEREHQQANPADLSGILVGGTFRRQDRLVEGHWPIPQAFLQALTAGSF